jgi:hypothetical protein
VFSSPCKVKKIICLLELEIEKITCKENCVVFYGECAILLLPSISTL